MERPPYIFQLITDFSVADMEKADPRINSIRKLTLRIGAKIPHGEYPLILIKPFPPHGRAGKELDRLMSLHAESIESIWAFPKPDDGEWARIEIRGRVPSATVFIKCERTEGVPGWDETQP